MKQDVVTVCRDALQWARDRSFAGYSKFDALNSPFVWKVTGWSRLLRAVAVFGLSRCPINIRPLLGVKKMQNPKGLALFARAYLRLHQLEHKTRDLEDAEKLLRRLVELSQRDSYSGHCWGYDHPWQNIAFFIPRWEPNAVVTCAAGEAFLAAYRETGKDEYLEVGESVSRFLLQDLPVIEDSEGERCCGYDLKSDWKVINVNALCASYMAKLHQASPAEELKQASTAMMRWVVNQQTDYGAWYYTDPPGASRITHDNYHTGFVLDALQDYLSVFERPEWRGAWEDGLEFYRDNLFTGEGAPKWMHDSRYPHDIHGAAQGIITFTKASAMDPSSRRWAGRVLEWTLENMWDDDDNRFYYQKGRIWTKTFTLMRWCQAWMCYALSVYMNVSGRDCCEN